MRITQPCDRATAGDPPPWSCGHERPHQPPMNRDPWPTDEAQRQAWVAAIVRDVDERRATGRGGILTDLLRTAWPSWLAQDQ